MTLIERVVATCCRLPVLVAALTVGLGVAGALYTSSHFNMDTDSAKLISPDVPWRQRETHFDKLFPQQVNLILVVIDGATPELGERAAAELSAALAADKKKFPIVRRPDGGDFFNKNGLLFLP